MVLVQRAVAPAASRAPTRKVRLEGRAQPDERLLRAPANGGRVGGAEEHPSAGVSAVPDGPGRGTVAWPIDRGDRDWGVVRGLSDQRTPADDGGVRLGGGGVDLADRERLHGVQPGVGAAGATLGPGGVPAEGGLRGRSGA